MKAIFLIILMVLIGVALFASGAQAQNTGSFELITCGGRGEPPCTVCDVFKLIQRAFNYALGLLSLIVLFIGIVVGIMFFIGSQNQNTLATAKKAGTAGLIGFLIILLAWLMVTGIGRMLDWNQQDSWWKIDCNFNQ